MKACAKEELDSIEWNNTRIQAVLLPGEDAFPCKVVLKRGLDKQGLGACYKTRLVANDYLQNDSSDYNEMATLVVRFYVLYFIVLKFKSVNEHVHHADIRNASLNGDIEGEQYVW